MTRPATFYAWLLIACFLGACADRREREDSAARAKRQLEIGAGLIAASDSIYTMSYSALLAERQEAHAALAATRESLATERADYMDCLMRSRIGHRWTMADTAYYVPGRDTIYFNEGKLRNKPRTSSADAAKLKRWAEAWTFPDSAMVVPDERRIK